ncbi:hypothetical protein H4R23_004101, partial [Coemansia sp. Cherry 401B]
SPQHAGAPRRSNDSHHHRPNSQAGAPQRRLTRLQQELIEERLIRPATTMPTLYLDCEDVAEQTRVLGHTKAMLAEASTDSQELALASAQKYFMRLAVLPRTWATYDKLIETPVVRDGISHYWYQANGRPVRIVAGGCGFVELALIRCALREIGEVRNLRLDTSDGLPTSEFTATIILPLDAELPGEIVLRSIDERILQLEELRADITPYCPACCTLSTRRCTHDRRQPPIPPPGWDAPRRAPMSSASPELGVVQPSPELLRFHSPEPEPEPAPVRNRPAQQAPVQPRSLLPPPEVMRASSPELIRAPSPEPVRTPSPALVRAPSQVPTELDDTSSLPSPARILARPTESVRAPSSVHAPTSPTRSVSLPSSPVIKPVAARKATPVRRIQESAENVKERTPPTRMPGAFGDYGMPSYYNLPALSEASASVANLGTASVYVDAVEGMSSPAHFVNDNSSLDLSFASSSAWSDDMAPCLAGQPQQHLLDEPEDTLEWTRAQNHQNSETARIQEVYPHLRTDGLSSIIQRRTQRSQELLANFRARNTGRATNRVNATTNEEVVASADADANAEVAANAEAVANAAAAADAAETANAEAVTNAAVADAEEAANAEAATN